MVRDTTDRDSATLTFSDCDVFTTVLQRHRGRFGFLA
jgi:hypothetical protein